MNKNNFTKTIKRRFFLLSTLKGLSFGILSWRLFDLQVVENKKYDKLSKSNQFNFSLVLPERGEIYDRKGRVLAANRDAFSLYVKLRDNINIDDIFQKLRLIYLNIQPHLPLQDTAKHISLQQCIMWGLSKRVVMGAPPPPL